MVPRNEDLSSEQGHIKPYGPRFNAISSFRVVAFVRRCCLRLASLRAHGITFLVGSRGFVWRRCAHRASLCASGVVVRIRRRCADPASLCAPRVIVVTRRLAFTRCLAFTRRLAFARRDCAHSASLCSLGLTILGGVAARSASLSWSGLVDRASARHACGDVGLPIIERAFFERCKEAREPTDSGCLLRRGFRVAKRGDVIETRIELALSSWFRVNVLIWWLSWWGLVSMDVPATGARPAPTGAECESWRRCRHPASTECGWRGQCSACCGRRGLCSGRRGCAADEVVSWWMRRRGRGCAADDEVVSPNEEMSSK